MTLFQHTPGLIRKAVFPVAGIGTRFLPATKASPKEMMPIVDKPLIQYAVEEAVSIGIQELIFVTSGTKRAIEDHFDKNFELEYRLEKAEKTALLDLVRNILPEGVRCIYIRQAEPLGLGHAILCAKSVVGSEPFAVLLADDLIENTESSCLSQMLAVFKEVRRSVVAVQKMPVQELCHYGVVRFAENFEKYGVINKIVEKPALGLEPSHLGVVGRYIFNPSLFAALEDLQKGVDAEIQLTDAIDKLLATETVYANLVQGTRYDCGSQLGYLQAIVHYGLKHPALGKAFEAFLKKSL
ncbi:MAG: UTP--glucose-1-phosphate uridylyltransferase GalU [Gammaproteobacteria bacterium]|nr:UTP--glucose-1-phosphate uridylyltransferase GalU [Gammaproteobacteria bacterium]MBP9729071.1 UTP--glucose-1-phosphate uridylyltransferase GalU [Gammaproteobacteria bacterium]